MITRIDKDFFFLAGVHFDDAYFINSYDMTVSLLVETDCSNEHYVALGRMDHFIKDTLANAVFVHRDEEDAIALYEQASMKVCELPERPLDQVIAIAILLKLNSITEGRFKVTDLTLGSMLSEGVRYPIVSELAENADIMMGDHWWYRPDLSITDKDMEPTVHNNVVKLFCDDDWADMKLSWKDKS